MILKIKKLAMLFALSLLVLSSVQAQRIELTANGGYQYWGSYNYSSYNPYTGNGVAGKLKLGDGPCYGATLGFELREGTMVELEYNHQDSKIVDRRNGYPDQTLCNLGVNYFLINGVRSVAVNEKLEPYGTMGIGAGVFDPDVAGYSSVWRLAMKAGAGVKYYFNDRVGLRLGFAFWAPIQGVGLGVGITSSGAYTGASAYTTIIQMNMSGGLIFRLKQ